MRLRIFSEKSSFSYHCGRCNECCRSRQVYVNPYEIVRLARNKGLSTTDLIDSAIDKRSFSLKQQADGSCVFLTADGCGVYADRPLACRLYPLARKKDSDGDVQFAAIPPEENSTGQYGTRGTVAHFLKEQQTSAYEDFSDRYFAAFSAITLELTQTSAQALLGNILLEHVPVSHRLLFDPTHADAIALLFDIHNYCRERGQEVGLLSAEELANRHLHFLVDAAR